MARKDVKKRNWTFIVYPESAPQDWREQLQKSGLLVAISPLHDKDVNPDGTPKKPHYHVILVYGNTTTYSNVASLTSGQLGQTIPQALEQVRGMYRYFTHEDNPEKAQYSKADIQHLNGFDIRDFVELTRTEVEKIKRQVLDFIVEREITEYIDLNLACTADDVPADWFGVVSSNTMYFDTVIRGLRFKLKGRRDE